MLEEIEKKQRDIQGKSKPFCFLQLNKSSIESRHKSGATTTPLLEYLKRIREERKQEKLIRNQQRRSNKQGGRNSASNITEEDYNASARYPPGR